MICRNCTNQLNHIFIDLNTSPPSNSCLSESMLSEKEVFYPLKAMICEKCFLVQVDEYQSSENIFNDSYTYFSSYSKSWLEHTKNYVENIIKKINLTKKSFVIEIASNDGYLLQNFKKYEIPCLGIEPTSNTAAVAKSKGIPTIEKFFGHQTSQEILTIYEKADLIIANNVLAHVPNLHDFVKGFNILLKDDGIITLEFPHLTHLVGNTQFDTIYHEHFSYFSLSFVNEFFLNHKLRIFDVEEIETHGGSLRVYACHLQSKIKNTNKVADLLTSEEKTGVKNIEYYRNFTLKAEKIKNKFLEFLLDVKKDGQKVAGYGAAAKGNTFINYAGIKSDLLPFVADASPHKQGKYLPGSRIPIISPEKLIEYSPDFVIIFPWNIKEEIIEQLKGHLTKTKFITFIPKFEIV